LFWRCGEERVALLWRAAVCPGGDGGLFDLSDRDCSGGQQAKHDTDTTRDAAIAMLPTSDGPRGDVKQLGDTVLREAERVEHRVEFGGGHRQIACRFDATRDDVHRRRGGTWGLQHGARRSHLALGRRLKESVHVYHWERTMHAKFERQDNNLVLRVPDALAERIGAGAGTPVELAVAGSVIIVRVDTQSPERLLQRSASIDWSELRSASRRR
jgi:antitoxin component of MazEF toxin-antitoxin module